MKIIVICTYILIIISTLALYNTANIENDYKKDMKNRNRDDCNGHE